MRGTERSNVAAKLNLHHNRMVARLKNVMDTLQRRSCPDQTAVNELGFLVQEVEAYRAFVHAHTESLSWIMPALADDDPCASADSLYFDVLKLMDRVLDHGARHPDTVAHIIRVGANLLDQARRCQSGRSHARASRLATLRALLHGHTERPAPI
ncbi:hypothetical protein [uncultured Rhodospira sp.]|uniref:hypothetical protein n=1 Tax=uncultured Rhodospira sp. TaxID=1936189 RepID=UPI00261AFD29|nr:hypothetical protein [uncultured Rhodospira sp.]